MIYEITINGDVDFAPETEAEEIIQNVRTILKTRLGTVPLARDFGITWEHLDKPVPAVKSIMQSVVVDAITDFEPRAKVEKVLFDGDGKEGIMKPRVIISIGGDEL